MEDTDRGRGHSGGGAQMSFASHLVPKRPQTGGWGPLVYSVSEVVSEI